MRTPPSLHGGATDLKPDPRLDAKLDASSTHRDASPARSPSPRYVAPSLRGVSEPHFPSSDDAYVEPVEDEQVVAAFVAEQLAKLDEERKSTGGKAKRQRSS